MLGLIVKLRSRSGEGQVKVRWRSGEAQEGQSQAWVMWTQRLKDIDLLSYTPNLVFTL